MMLGGCAPESPAPTGRHVDVHVQDEKMVLCAGTVEHLDRFVEQVFVFLDEPVPDDFVVPIELFSAQHPCDATGCFLDGKIWARLLETAPWDTPGRLLRHEVVHAVQARAWGNSVPFFNEGLAQSLSSLTRSRPGSTAIGDMLDKPAEALDYDEAGRFVRFLVDTRGILRFCELVRGAAGKDAAGLRAWIGDVYAEDFAGIEAEFLSGDPRCHDQLYLCDAADAEQIVDAWSMDLFASCDSPEFYGVSSAQAGLFATRRSLEITQGGRYRVTRTLDVDPTDPRANAARVTWVRCGTCDQVDVEDRLPGESELQLTPGVYALEVIMPLEGAVTVELVRLGD